MSGTWSTKPERGIVQRTIQALGENGIGASVVATREEAARQALSLIPPGSEVFTGTSVTLEELGLEHELNESGRYLTVKGRLAAMDPHTQQREMRKVGAGPDYSVGSVQAVTETGSVMIASLTGSQIPSYAYGAGRVIWIVGVQKIVKDIDEGFRRIREYLVERETERARKAYGLPESFESFPSKILLFGREVRPGRVTLLFVDEVIGH
ncbi:MAG TPA: LUD domain-containing protein [Spirochaetia bacterium]|nr:LUD domain-containing protein [Spirochaetia bacterium]